MTQNHPSSMNQGERELRENGELFIKEKLEPANFSHL
jgi:hypothetical protein